MHQGFGNITYRAIDAEPSQSSLQRAFANHGAYTGNRQHSKPDQDIKRSAQNASSGSHAPGRGVVGFPVRLNSRLFPGNVSGVGP